MADEAKVEGVLVFLSGIPEPIAVKARFDEFEKAYARCGEGRLANLWLRLPSGQKYLFRFDAIVSFCSADLMYESDEAEPG